MPLSHEEDEQSTPVDGEVSSELDAFYRAISRSTRLAQYLKIPDAVTRTIYNDLPRGYSAHPKFKTEEAKRNARKIFKDQLDKFVSGKHAPNSEARPKRTSSPGDKLHATPLDEIRSEIYDTLDDYVAGFTYRLHLLLDVRLKQACGFFSCRAATKVSELIFTDPNLIVTPPDILDGNESFAPDPEANAISVSRKRGLQERIRECLASDDVPSDADKFLVLVLLDAVGMFDWKEIADAFDWQKCPKRFTAAELSAVGIDRSWEAFEEVMYLAESDKQSLCAFLYDYGDALGGLFRRQDESHPCFSWNELRKGFDLPAWFPNFATWDPTNLATDAVCLWIPKPKATDRNLSIRKMRWGNKYRAALDDNDDVENF